MTCVCINRGKIKSLTIGKTYQITKTNNGTHQGSDKTYSNVWVINDKGDERHYSAKRFVSLDEYRERQLSKVLTK